MQTQNDDRKQATSGDIDGFINILTKMLESNILSDNGKETLKQALCNLADTTGEEDITDPQNMRAWLIDLLDLDEAEQPEEGRPFVIFHDEEDAQQSIDLIVGRTTKHGLGTLADILIQLDELTSGGPEEIKKANKAIWIMLEMVFRRSTSYWQAFRLYKRRFDIAGGGDPDKHLTQFVARQLPVRSLAFTYRLNSHAELSILLTRFLRQ